MASKYYPYRFNVYGEEVYPGDPSYWYGEWSRPQSDLSRRCDEMAQELQFVEQQIKEREMSIQPEYPHTADEPKGRSLHSELQVGDMTVIEENGKRLTGVVTAIVDGSLMIQWSDGEMTEEDG